MTDNGPVDFVPHNRVYQEASLDIVLARHTF
jgi:hypothetical protein